PINRMRRLQNVTIRLFSEYIALFKRCDFVTWIGLTTRKLLNINDFIKAVDMLFEMSYERFPTDATILFHSGCCSMPYFLINMPPCANWCTSSGPSACRHHRA